MFVVYEMDGGYSGDVEYVSQVFGPFSTEAEADAYIIQQEKLCKGYARLTTIQLIPIK